MDGLGNSASAANLQQFLDLSSELTGFPTSELNAERAQILLDLLMDSNLRDALVSAMKADTSEVKDELAEVMITFWYAGIIAIQNDVSVDTYIDALVWKSVWFATPKTVCSPIPNDWSLPPEPATS